MADLQNYKVSKTVNSDSDVAIDQGLRSYMLSVYNLMALGLFITGIVAYSVFSAAVVDGQLTAFGSLIYVSSLKWLVFFAPLALVFFLGFKITSLPVSTARMVFFLYSGLIGLSLSSVFLIYTGQSVTQTFFVTASAFGALSLYGYTTRSDLTALGSFMIMGVFGILIAMLVNIFLQSSAIQFAISAIGVLAFSGLTAYDTQRIKEMYWQEDSSDIAGRKAIMGALTLYLDFINLFTFLLHFLGKRD